MKEVFYLTTHSTHFFYSYISCRCTRLKEGNVLFNDALNTFYLRLYALVDEIEGRKCFI